MAKTRTSKSLTKQDLQVKLKNHHHPAPPQTPLQKPASWALVKSLFTCKHIQLHLQQQQQPPPPPEKVKQQQNVQQKQHKVQTVKETTKNKPKSKSKSKKVMCSGSLCNNTNVMHRPAEPLSPEDKNKNKKKIKVGSNSLQRSRSRSRSSNRSTLKDNKDMNAPVVSSNYCVSPFKGMPFMKLSGCYECRMVVDPVLGFTKDSSLRATLCSCNVCGEIFMKADYLELHQATRHAVSELGPEDTSKNIVEIIFQSSWLRKQSPICKIDRILKVNNTPKTIAKFEEYRDAIKIKATKLPKKHSRCIADGNELLRFHCTTFKCSLGLNGSSNLCNSIPNCGVCSIIKGGFRTAAAAAGEGAAGNGILTTASSGKAHDSAGVAVGNEKRAMLVCRVIAGRVRKNLEGGSSEEYDSVAGAAGVYSNLDELFVFNPRAILPCFVVIYDDGF